MKQDKTLSQIWEQVPPNYYDQGISSNILQKIWHGQKIYTLKLLLGNYNFKSILDVGCAGGTMANRISQVFPESKVTGVDVYQKAIDYGRKKYPQIIFKKVDAHKLPFRDNSFDLVVCYETIEHVINPLLVLKEIKRVTKKDGLTLVVMDSGNWLFRGVWWVWEKTKGKVWDGAHLHPFHHNQLEQTIKKAGFQIKEKYFSHLGMEVSFLLKK